MRTLTVLCVLFWMSACDGETRCGDDPVSGACNSDLSRGACLREGGCWGTWGMAPAASCNCPTLDAGTPCQTAEDCEGRCLADPDDDGLCPAEGTCSDMQGVYGCYCFLSGDGAPEAVMCVD